MYMYIEQICCGALERARCDPPSPASPTHAPTPTPEQLMGSGLHPSVPSVYPHPFIVRA